MKTVQSVKNSLKFKAKSKEGALTVRIGVKKLVLPVSVRMLQGEGYLFLSIPATSEIYSVDGAKLAALSGDTDASAAYTALNPGRKRRRTSKAGAELPASLAAELKKLPEGYRLGFGTDGAPRLVRTRNRKKK